METMFSVIIVAAGKGTRMGMAESKQHLPLAGVPILVHTLRVFEALEAVREVVLVVGEHDRARCERYIVEYGLQKAIRVVAGGTERQSSVHEGLKAIAVDAQWVLIHDGVRPFVTEDEVLRCWHKAVETGAAVLAVPVKDTVKRVSVATGKIEATPDRRTLWAVHTPQAFQVSAIREAHELAERESIVGTDDAMLLERLGRPVHVVEGRYTNVKITTLEDLEWAEWRISLDKGGNGR